MLGFADADHVVSYSETETGEPYADIWRISMVESPPYPSGFSTSAASGGSDSTSEW